MLAFIAGFAAAALAANERPPRLGKVLQHAATDAKGSVEVPAIVLGDEEVRQFDGTFGDASERFAVVVAPWAKTVEIFLLIAAGRETDFRLRVWRDHPEPEGTEAREEEATNCDQLLDDCMQNRKFQYRRPSFIPAGSPYTGRLALRLQPAFRAAVAGRWEVEIARSGGAQAEAVDVRVIVRQGRSGFWGTVLSTLAVLVCAFIASVALFDMLWVRRGVHRVHRPADEDSNSEPGSATGQVWQVAQAGAQWARGPQPEGQRTPRPCSLVIVLRFFLLHIAYLAAFFVIGAVCKLVFGVMERDLSAVRWSPDGYHLMLSVAAVLGYFNNAIMFRPALRSLPWLAGRVLLVGSLGLQVAAGYLVMFMLWCFNSAVWNWQVPFCTGVAAVNFYRSEAHAVFVRDFDRWQQARRREVVIEPPGASSAASGKDELQELGSTPASPEASVPPPLAEQVAAASQSPVGLVHDDPVLDPPPPPLDCDPEWGGNPLRAVPVAGAEAPARVSV
eukprot:Hpha_TRINITY_DN23332_c0_g1::TRINITY_DN23332_c0_g1_i1::g.96849::m.96849